jgi:tetratricopeptide (TPR) repeat protein
MNKFLSKINKFEIKKTDNKIEFFNGIIENSITSKSDKLYEQAGTFCGIECKKCFEICDEIIKMNPHYIQAYLKKIRCKKRTDRLVQLKECEDLLIKFPKYSMKIKFEKLSILSKFKNRKEELRILLNELSKLNDTEIGNYNGELAISFGKLNMHSEAIIFYSKHISENPNSDYAYNNRGVQFEEIGQYENAISDIKKSIELIESSKEIDYEESLNRSKRNLLRVEGKLTSQNDGLPF